jgi:hypothetical protein
MRVALDLVVLARCEVDGLERVVDPRRRVATVERGDQLEVLATRHVRVEARRLDETGDAVQGARPLHEGVAPEQLRRALVGPDQAEQHAQRRGLPGPVRAEVAVDVAGPHGQVDVVDRRDVAVALDQPARFNGIHRSPRAAFSAASGGTEPATT